VFDTRSPGQASPNLVKPMEEPEGYVFTCNGLLAPSKYGGSVALCSNDYVNGTGGIAVYESKDGWRSAQWKGFIVNNNPLTTGSTPTATVEIAESIYISEEFFPSIVTGTGNSTVSTTRSSFPYVDITAQGTEPFGARMAVPHMIKTMRILVEVAAFRRQLETLGKI
jgi:hypothetical protein